MALIKKIIAHNELYAVVTFDEVGVEITNSRRERDADWQHSNNLAESLLPTFGKIYEESISNIVNETIIEKLSGDPVKYYDGPKFRYMEATSNSSITIQHDTGPVVISKIIVGIGTTLECYEKNDTLKRYQSPGRCVYCDEIAAGDEHIIPEFLGGISVLPNASCKKCEDITHRFEGHCGRGMLRQARFEIGYPTKHKKDIPKHFKMFKASSGGRMSEEFELVAVAEYPRLLALPSFGKPGIAGGRSTGENFEDVGFFFKVLNEVKVDNGAAYPVAHIQFKIGPFAQMLAKIAHCIAVGEFGIDGFVHRLRDPIKTGRNIAHYVGGADDRVKPALGEDHWINIETRKIGRKTWVVVWIRLFAFIGGLQGTPTYSIVVGELRSRPAKRALMLVWKIRNYLKRTKVLRFR